MYQREIKIPYREGSVLIYRHDLWHRGTPVNNDKIRYVLNLGFKKAGCDYITNWNEGWAKTLCWNKDYLETLIPTLSDLQLRCLGFPAIDSNYWDKPMRDAVNMRYSKHGYSPISKL